MGEGYHFTIMVIFTIIPNAKKSKATLYQRAPRLPASPSLIIFQFHPLVVSLSDIVDIN